MKSTVILALLLTCTLHLFAQRCDYVKDENDKFTGKKFILTKSPLFKEFTKQSDIDFSLYHDSLYVSLSYVEASPQPIESDMTSELWLSLSDGSVMKLKISDAYKGRVRGTMGGVMESVFQPSFFVSKEQLTTLTMSPVTGFRVGHSNGAIQKDVPEKFQKRIRIAAKCLLDVL